MRRRRRNPRAPTLEEEAILRAERRADAEEEVEAKEARALHGDILPDAQRVAELLKTAPDYAREQAIRLYAEWGRKLNGPGAPEGRRRDQRRRLKTSRLYLIDVFGQEIRGKLRTRDFSAEAQRLRSRRHFTLTKPKGHGVMVILLGQDGEPYREWFLQGSDLWGPRKTGALGRSLPTPAPGEAPGPLRKGSLVRLLRLLADRIESE
jgi:hypothetical protein